jgi:hypothetical protein
MNFIAAVIAGVVGTLAMFIFILLSPLVVRVPKINIYDYMGTLFTKDPRLARIIGVALLSFPGAMRFSSSSKYLSTGYIIFFNLYRELLSSHSRRF